MDKIDQARQAADRRQTPQGYTKFAVRKTTTAKSVATLLSPDIDRRFAPEEGLEGWLVVGDG
jgi:hypothetical protein